MLADKSKVNIRSLHRCLRLGYGECQARLLSLGARFSLCLSSSSVPQLNAPAMLVSYVEPHSSSSPRGIQAAYIEARTTR
eukprot:scaffold314429_cov32-Tisochrysis_lutea.AAC.3